MKAVFLSHVLSDESPCYGGKKSVSLDIHRKRVEWGFIQETTISCNSHVGTHIDFPKHFIDNSLSGDQLPANSFIFSKVSIVEIKASPGELIELSQFFAHISSDCELLLLKTNWEEIRQTDLYWKNNPGITASSASWLRTHRPNVRCIGFDFISLTSQSNKEEGRLAHQSFLGDLEKPIFIIEDMSLYALPSEDQIEKIVVSPLRFYNMDGSPATILAFLSEL